MAATQYGSLTSMNFRKDADVLNQSSKAIVNQKQKTKFRA